VAPSIDDKLGQLEQKSLEDNSG